MIPHVWSQQDGLATVSTQGEVTCQTRGTRLAIMIERRGSWGTVRDWDTPLEAHDAQVWGNSTAGV